MRKSALEARRLDVEGREVFRVTTPVDFTLDQAAVAMHAVVDAHLARPGSRERVGRARVPEVLREIARGGWPSGFEPQLDRVLHWRTWLIDNNVFQGEPTIEEQMAAVTTLATTLETGFTPNPVKCAHVTTFLNQKGGVGKTGLTAGTAGALSERGRSVLVIDLDPQGHLTTEALGMDEVDPGEMPDSPTLANALTGDYTGPLESLIVNHSTHSSGGRLDVLPTTVSMFLVPRKLYQLRKMEARLARLIDRLPPIYDHILIDCPPSLDVLVDNALVVAGRDNDSETGKIRKGGIIIPVQPSKTSLRALRLLLDQLATLEGDLGLEPRDLYGMVPGLYRKPLPGIAKYVMGELEKFAAPIEPEDSDDPMVPPLPILAHLPLATAVEEAWLAGKPITQYARNSPHAKAHRRIALRLDVAAGLNPQSEWEALPALPTLSE